MANDASIFFSLRIYKKEIFVDDDYTLIIVNCGKNECHKDVIIDTYHVPTFSVNLMSIPQPTQTHKEVEFWPNQFVVKYMHNNFVVIF